MSGLLKSRKFWLMIFDVAISTATYFISQIVSDPQVAENILWLIAAWQPVIISVIIGITAEDTAVKSNPNTVAPPAELVDK